MLIDSYTSVTKKIIELINCDTRMTYFYDLLKKADSEESFEKLYTELGHYLLTRINKRIDSNKIITANNEVEKLIHNDPKLVSIGEFKERDTKAFPYIVNGEHILSERKK